MYSLPVFTGGRPLCTQILTGKGQPPSAILGIRKLETLHYLSDGEDRIPVRFLVFDTIPECDGRIDGRICRSIYSACGALYQTKYVFDAAFARVLTKDSRADADD